jgi:putative DNA primase/helicase
MPSNFNTLNLDGNAADTAGVLRPTMPRAFVIVGTSNERQFLTDHTSSRRFWSILLPPNLSQVEDQIDLRLLRAERDQLWAQAVATYRAAVGEAREHLWWLTPAEEARLAERNVEHREVDAIEEKLAALVEASRPEGIGTWDLLDQLQPGSSHAHSQMECWRARRALEALGYEEKRLAGPGRPRRWVHRAWKKERTGARRGNVLPLATPPAGVVKKRKY